MIRYTHKGESTPWFNKTPTEYHLNQFTITQLVVLIMAKKLKGFKKVLIDFILSKNEIN